MEQVAKKRSLFECIATSERRNTCGTVPGVVVRAAARHPDVLSEWIAENVARCHHLRADKAVLIYSRASDEYAIVVDGLEDQGPP